MNEIPIVYQAKTHAKHKAIVSDGQCFVYQNLLDDSARVAASLLCSSQALRQKRVAFLFPSGYDYVRVQWGIWRAGGVAVPLATSHPPPELEYVLRDSQADVVLVHPQYTRTAAVLCKKMALRLMTLAELPTEASVELPEVDHENPAMIMYTSGTSGKPKGVVSTHRNIAAQIQTLIKAWGWTHRDRILQMLPLHHVHGIVNITCCALWAGAICDMLPRFDVKKVWQRIQERKLTLLMAVPTIYAKLVTEWEQAPPETQEQWTDACNSLRLMISGSAALPVALLEKWEAISGHKLLERYGMTEIGMALSNPLKGTRVAGHVGRPLPGVGVRLVNEQGAVVMPGQPGEIQIKGPSVFKEYWGRSQVTRDAFAGEWFKTGDIACVDNGSYRILGRINMDIIKTGGYQVSALEIEEVLAQYDGILECAVVGLPHAERGELVAAALVSRDGGEIDPEAVRLWTKQHLAPYKAPAQVVTVNMLPRDILGKVNKQEVVKLFQTGGAA